MFSTKIDKIEAGLCTKSKSFLQAEGNVTRWFVWKKHRLTAVLWTLCAMAVAVSAIAVPVCVRADSPRGEFTIVIDAGHGGIDGGVTGVNTGTPEAGLNLDIAKRLKNSFEGAGIGVVLTRATSAGLYGHATEGMKAKDMKARAAIIASVKPDLVISIHQNAFPLHGERGAHVFFRKDSQPSREYALRIQQQLKENLPCSDRVPQAGDYYILNCTDVPAVLVECGFLSNPEDEANLLKEEYREKVAHHIFLGVMSLYVSKSDSAAG